jgi:hypothetical protein
MPRSSYLFAIVCASAAIGCTSQSQSPDSNQPASEKHDASIIHRNNTREEYEDSIKNDPDYLAIKNLLDRPICTQVRYYGHLSPDAGYNPITYGKNKDLTFMQTLDRPGEFEEKWKADPQHKKVCFSPDQSYWSPPDKPSEFLNSVKGSRDPESSSILMLRDKDTPSRIYVDCAIRQFRDTYRRDDTSEMWSFKTMEPFISVGLTELDLICENPGIKAISSGKVFDLL